MASSRWCFTTRFGPWLLVSPRREASVVPVTIQQNRPTDIRLQLHAEVHNALAGNPYFAGRKVRIELRENEVVLSGILGSYFHKQMAQESVRSIRGVRRVHNQIEVVSA
jgi:osmotically-inducible protein OsmY